MIVRYTTAMIATLVLGCACQRIAETHPKEEPESMTESTPPTIELTVDGRTIRARLVNGLDRAIGIVHTPLHQPSELVLVAADGTTVEPFDSRSIKKYDGTIFQTHVTEIAAGQAIDLFTAEFTSTPDGYRAEWGPFGFEGVPAGQYSVTVRWTSTITRCVDENSLDEEPVPNAWTGEATSATSKLQLP